ncbi:hypothetical protein J2848_005222 [Azospirillum lipoferum]|uniref:Uncharacterized protein n=1 Tax=Azospirillum lipoferum TaxID=193 RepID=A0A5A9GHD1_AZOLI|nr:MULTISPECIES: hypothetical protein [Azospirillum]KAA0593124.1 hypothetical protein FZ942_24600 [Azospirillum lipoferum]MCP1613526.1 hypothetical protein [Azospirillum lipoferum]MDW5532295.1 hypothetical protein [Azospirillum sp. NL1]
MNWDKAGCILMAGVGGTLPTLARLAGYYSQSTAGPAPGADIYIALGLYFLLGSIVCIGLQQFSLREAMTVGVSAPAIITGFINGQNQPIAKKDDSFTPPKEIVVPAKSNPNSTGWLEFFAPSAYAAQTSLERAVTETPTASPTGVRSVIFKIRQDVGLPPVSISLGAANSGDSQYKVNGAMRFQGIARLDTNAISQQFLPSMFDRIVVSAGERTSNILALPRDTEISKVCVFVDLLPGNDFTWGLGAPRQGRIQDAILTLEPIGEDPCRLNDLIEGIDGNEADARKRAVATIISDYKDRPEVVERALLLLKPERFDRLSGNGRVNLYYLLSQLSDTAWTKELIQKARDGLASVEDRAKNGPVAIGPQAAQGMENLRKRLDIIASSK